jgi:DNA helicase HerA-like ATPase
MDSALVDEPSGVQLGWGKQNGKSYPVHLPDSDRKLHINIVGKSGMGKSTFMHHLIRHDIECGVGLAVIDPHGTLIKDILQTSIPSHRESDVVLLDLADKDNPPPLNPLRGHSTYVGLGRVVNVIERMFAGTEGHARLSKYLRAAIGLLAHDEHATMRDVSRVFTDEEYRYKLLESGDNGLVEEVWNAYELLSQPQREQIIDPILNRIAPFFSNPLLLPVFCHPDGLNFGTLMQERKIILV